MAVASSRPGLRWSALLAFAGACVCAALAPGCDCAGPGGSDAAPGTDALAEAGSDAGSDAATPPLDAGVDCDLVTGEGCTCATPGAMRACDTGELGACATGAQSCELLGEFPFWGPCMPAAAPAGELCADGIDSDCDGDLDCTDADCAADPACASCATAETGACTGGADEDCDGDSDCLDPDCAADPACDTCVAAETGACTGGADEDCDGAVDCADTDCAGDAACPCPCESGGTCFSPGFIICYPAPGYTCPVMDGYYAECTPAGWSCMFTLPAIC